MGFLCATVLVAAAWAAIAAADVPVPSLEGPIGSPGSAFLQSTAFPLADVGYTDREYFIAGTATAYTNVGPLGDDGKWTAAPGATAAYKTRIVVRHPVEAKKFNGTVVVEWLNVSGGLDAAPDWTLAHTELIRDGFAWVGVSAQRVGVEGGGGLVNVVDLGLKQANPARYGSLHHPGDSFSYDMFSQAAQAVLGDAAILFGDLRIRRLIAAGESQSAFRMVTYVNAIHPLTHLFDGYFVHSRGAVGANLSEAPQPVIPVPGAAPIRSDLDVPVLVLETETDLTFLGYVDVRQDDTRKFRGWEVAGTSHADVYTVTKGAGDRGNNPNIVALTVTSKPIPGIIVCNQPINDGPHHFIVNAAFFYLNRWIRNGHPPNPAPRLDVTATATSVTINRDANGNALGGIRTPEVDVPIAAFTGEQAGSILCRLFGTTTPFGAAKLGMLYPTHKEFFRAYTKAAQRAVHAGFLLKADSKLMRAWAATAPIGN